MLILNSRREVIYWDWLCITESSWLLNFAVTFMYGIVYLVLTGLILSIFMHDTSFLTLLSSAIGIVELAMDGRHCDVPCAKVQGGCTIKWKTIHWKGSSLSIKSDVYQVLQYLSNFQRRQGLMGFCQFNLARSYWYGKTFFWWFM